MVSGDKGVTATSVSDFFQKFGNENFSNHFKSVVNLCFFCFVRKQTILKRMFFVSDEAGAKVNKLQNSLLKSSKY